jgi:hypothetical protein
MATPIERPSTDSGRLFKTEIGAAETGLGGNLHSDLVTTVDLSILEVYTDALRRPEGVVQQSAPRGEKEDRGHGCDYKAAALDAML